MGKCRMKKQTHADKSYKDEKEVAFVLCEYARIEQKQSARVNVSGVDGEECKGSYLRRTLQAVV